ncbi:MAG TPA: hypothetical protein VF992_11660 [Thermoplasmata archaeon]
MEFPDEESTESVEAIRRRAPEGLLALASVLLLAANVLRILAAFLNFLGVRVGWDAGKTVWVAPTTDLVGAAILGSVFFLAATRAEGMQGHPTPPVPPENLSSKDLVATIDGPDLLERLRYGPKPPGDARLKR